jgi:hypothetical protein
MRLLLLGICIASMWLSTGFAFVNLFLFIQHGQWSSLIVGVLSFLASGMFYLAIWIYARECVKRDRQEEERWPK